MPGVRALGATAPGGPTRAGAIYVPVPRAYRNLTRNAKYHDYSMSENTRDVDLIVLGRALRVLRDQAGLTQEQLAARLRMDATYISRIERGRRGVQWLTVQRFLRALDADPHRLADAMVQAEQRDDPSER